MVSYKYNICIGLRKVAPCGGQLGRICRVSESLGVLFAEDVRVQDISCGTIGPGKAFIKPETMGAEMTDHLRFMRGQNNGLGGTNVVFNNEETFLAESDIPRGQHLIQ